MKNALILSAIGAAFVLSTGCNFTEKYCESAIDCMGEDLAGTVDECVTASDTAAADADTAGCGDEYDDAAACSYKNSTCTEEGEGDYTYDLYSPGSTCDTEAKAYLECMNAAATAE